jgi:FkbM family methyltransferase
MVTREHEKGCEVEQGSMTSLVHTVGPSIHRFDWNKLIPNGSGISLDYVDALVKQINEGVYEPFFKEKKDLTFLDIGANLGLVSIYAYDACRKIVAVEPAPNVLPILLELTKDFPNITVVSAALDAYDGQHEFFVNDVNFTASSTENTYGVKTVVECRKLTTILKDYGLRHVDFCKMDIEGAEEIVLDDETVYSVSGIIDQFFIEFHNTPRTKWEYKLDVVGERLSRSGYQIKIIDKEGMAITATK